MARERQYERTVVKDSVSNRRSDVRDNSITDITIIDFDTVGQLGQWGQVPLTLRFACGSLVPVPIDPSDPEGNSSPAVGLVNGDAPPRSRLYLDTTGYPCAVGLVGGSLKLAGVWGDSSPAVGLVEVDARPCVSTISADKRIKRIVHIKRQNDVEIVSADSSVVQVRDSVRVRENEQNKSSPDKGSQAMFSIVAVIVISIIIIAIIVFIKFIVK